jgi:hypothetical protein
MSEIDERCDRIEQCYEFMLGFAGKGLPADQGSQVRYHLERAAEALTGLAQEFRKVVEARCLEPAGKYHDFLAVLERDARDSLAAVELVLAQPTISSLLIDNLNASIHLRALLTDIFLIDGILDHRTKTGEAVAS